MFLKVNRVIVALLGARMKNFSPSLTVSASSDLLKIVGQSPVCVAGFEKHPGGDPFSDLF